MFAVLYVLVLIIVVNEDGFVNGVGNGVCYLTHVVSVGVEKVELGVLFGLLLSLWDVLVVD